MDKKQAIVAINNLTLVFQPFLNNLHEDIKLSNEGKEFAINNLNHLQNFINQTSDD